MDLSPTPYGDRTTPHKDAVHAVRAGDAGWVEVIQTDDGAEFQSSFHWQVLDRGSGNVHIKPRTPRLNGKVERSRRPDQ